MKRAYKHPIAKKVDYAFDTQVTASSIPISTLVDPYVIDRCTWGDSSCNVVFNKPTTRGINNCSYQGS